MTDLQGFNWQHFLEEWNTQAMGVHIRALRCHGVGDSYVGGRRAALVATAKEFGLQLPETVFQPLGELGSDAEILAEAQRRIQEIIGILTPSNQARWPNLNYFGQDYHWTVIRHGGHFFPAATEVQIAEAEHRLGKAAVGHDNGASLSPNAIATMDCFSFLFFSAVDAARPLAIIAHRDRSSDGRCTGADVSVRGGK